VKHDLGGWVGNYFFIAYCIRRGLKHNRCRHGGGIFLHLYSLLHSQRIETSLFGLVDKDVRGFIAYCIRRGLKPASALAVPTVISKAL